MINWTIANGSSFSAEIRQQLPSLKHVDGLVTRLGWGWGWGGVGVRCVNPVKRRCVYLVAYTARNSCCFYQTRGVHAP